MIVYRYWYATLDRRSLLHTLVRNYREFLKLKEMIERQPHRAAQVEKLQLFPISQFVLDKRIL
jgi:hypothetical protein